MILPLFSPTSDKKPKQTKQHMKDLYVGRLQAETEVVNVWFPSSLLSDNAKSQGLN